jgi:hypothetical protein
MNQGNIMKKKTSTEPEEAQSCVSSGGSSSKENRARHSLPVLFVYQGCGNWSMANLTAS